MKKCLISLIIREIQNRATVRSHLTRIRIAEINTANNSYWQGCGERETLLHRWWECKLEQPFWKTVWRFLKKLKIELPYDSAIPLLDNYQKDTKILIQRDTCTPMFISALSTIVKLRKEPKCPLIDEWDEWVKKRLYIYIYTHIYIYSNSTQPSKRMKSCHLQWHG